MTMNNDKFNKKIILQQNNGGYFIACNVNYEYIKNKITPLKYDLHSKIYNYYNTTNLMLVEINFYVDIKIRDSSYEKFNKLPIFKINITDRQHGFASHGDTNHHGDKFDMLIRDYDIKYIHEYKRNIDEALSKLYGNRKSSLSILCEVDIDQLREDIENHINEKIVNKKYHSDDLVINYDYIREQLKRIAKYIQYPRYDIKPKYGTDIEPINVFIIAENEYRIESKKWFLIIESELVLRNHTNLNVSLGKTHNDYQTLLINEKFFDVSTDVLSLIPEMKKKMNEVDKEIKNFFDSVIVIS